MANILSWLRGQPSGRGGYSTPQWIMESVVAGHIENHMKSIGDNGYNPLSGIYYIDFPHGEVTENVQTRYIPSVGSDMVNPYTGSEFSIQVRGDSFGVKVDDCKKIKDVNKALKTYFNGCKINGVDPLKEPFFIGFAYSDDELDFPAGILDAP